MLSMYSGKRACNTRTADFHSVYHSSLYTFNDHWFPIKQLNRPADGAFAQSTLTIMFVLSAHILHQRPSYDPIFPAQDRNKDGWYNANPQARVLACVDLSEIYSRDEGQHWESHEEDVANYSDDAGTWLMRLAMDDSNTNYAMHWRLGSALLAQQNISHYTSLPLASNQWELEARQFFATSLARIQYNARGIASGEDHERSGYVDNTPDEAKGRLCGLYKFKTPNHTNISLVGFLGYILLAFAMYVLSWKLPSKRGDSLITPVVSSFSIKWVYGKCANCFGSRT